MGDAKGSLKMGFALFRFFLKKLNIYPSCGYVWEISYIHLIGFQICRETYKRELRESKTKADRQLDFAYIDWEGLWNKDRMSSSGFLYS